MKNLFILLIAMLFVVGCKLGTKKRRQRQMCIRDRLENVACCEKGPLNQLTDAEKAQGWLLMFDGTTSDGWRGYNKTNFPAAWVVEDGTLKCRSEESRGDTGKVDGGDIVYLKQLFSDFDLRLEWKISEAGNSGVFYLAKEIPGWPIYKSGLEMQILDNEKNPDSNRGRDGNRKAGSLDDLITANPQNAKTLGEWNSIEIICLQGKVVHRQNGVKILELSLIHISEPTRLGMTSYAVFCL